MVLRVLAPSTVLVLFHVFFVNVVISDDFSAIRNQLSLVQLLSSGYFNNVGKDTGQKSLCRRHIVEVFNSIRKKDLWALELIDAWGKVPSGILWGHNTALGAFDQCLSITKDFDYGPRLQGKYCMANLNADIPPDLRSNMTKLATYDERAAIRTGICVPNSCSAVEIQDMLTKLARKYLNLNLNETISVENSCKVKESVEFRTIDWVALMIFCVFGVIILCCSVYEYVINRRGESGNPLFLSFSIFSNGSKLFQMKRTTSPDVIECLHGIKSLSMMWVVFLHTYLTYKFASTINPKIMLQWMSTVYSMVFQFGTVSVDSFLLMSGLLVSWSMLRVIEKRKGLLNIPMAYLHRVLRLTPLLSACVLFSTTLTRYMGSGPNWEITHTYLVKPCTENWWSTLLYVQNYVNPEDICISPTWYLSVDMQLYLMAPFIMMCMYKWATKTVLMLIVFILLSIACTFATYMKNTYSMLLMYGFPLERFGNLYYPTHTRMAPWLIGLIFGYYFYKYKNDSIKLPKKFTLPMWLAALVVIGAIIFGPYGKTQPGATETILEGAFYESLIRMSWSIALAVIIFLCHTGSGGIINSILSATFWQPISRLSYSIYLTHAIVQLITAANRKTDVYISNLDTIYLFWGYFCITFMISTVGSLVFELPFIQISTMILKRGNIDSSNTFSTNNSNLVKMKDSTKL